MQAEIKMSHSEIPHSNTPDSDEWVIVRQER